MGDSGELADGLVFLIAQQVVELRIDFLQVIGDFGDGLFQSHLCHDAADAGAAEAETSDDTAEQ